MRQILSPVSRIEVREIDENITAILSFRPERLDNRKIEKYSFSRNSSQQNRVPLDFSLEVFFFSRIQGHTFLSYTELITIKSIVISLSLLEPPTLASAPQSQTPRSRPTKTRVSQRPFNKKSVLNVGIVPHHVCPRSKTH